MVWRSCTKSSSVIRRTVARWRIGLRRLCLRLVAEPKVNGELPLVQYLTILEKLTDTVVCWFVEICRMSGHRWNWLVIMQEWVQLVSRAVLCICFPGHILSINTRSRLLTHLVNWSSRRKHQPRSDPPFLKQITISPPRQLAAAAVPKELKKKRTW